MKSIFLLLFFKFVSCVPPDYCLQALNQSDCNVEPVPVFSYYKPGSRCEIQMWKGCPTQNKFSDQIECIYICIKRASLREQVIDEEETELEGFETPSYCLKKLNHKHCGRKFELVYTYVPEVKRCEWTTWFNCNTQNKFKDEASCYSACTGKEHNENDNENEIEIYIENLNKLPEDQLYEIIDIINNEIESDLIDVFPTEYGQLVSTDTYLSEYTTVPATSTGKTVPVINTDKTTSAVTETNTEEYYGDIDLDNATIPPDDTLDDIIVLEDITKEPAL